MSFRLPPRALVPVLAASLLGGSAALYWGALWPAAQRLERARQHLAALQARPGQRGALPAAAGLDLFYRGLPPESGFPDALARLVEVAGAAGLSLDEGGYKVVREPAGKLVRYQIELPLHGTYPQLRSFLSALPRALPASALERVQFERGRVDQGVLDARVGVLLFRASAP